MSLAGFGGQRFLVSAEQWTVSQQVSLLGVGETDLCKVLQISNSTDAIAGWCSERPIQRLAQVLGRMIFESSVERDGQLLYVFLVFCRWDSMYG